VGVDIRITLTLFSILAPAGALAFIAMALQVLWRRRRELQDGQDEREGQGEVAQYAIVTERLEHWLILPLVVCAVGFVASATHLGTPANALYVIMGWGRSPLSNEVVAAVGFLFLAGMYWLFSFVRRRPPFMMRLWLVLACVMALWLVSMISMVYAIPTIPTWDNDYMRFDLWAIACVGGPPLAIVSFVFSGVEVPAGYLKGLFVVSVTGLIAGIVLLCLHNVELATIRGAYGTAAQLVPGYGWCIFVWAVLSGSGLFVVTHAVLCKRTPASGLANPRRPVLVGTILVLAAAIFVRVPFYTMLMTVGL
jgi:anaerobic dimethyl sulfoxide reductase subunit C (anchor subunit)